MNVASLCPLPVGIVAWESPEPTLTVVVKVTFSLRKDGEAALAEEQAPLVLDWPSTLQRDELATSSDFAPRKASADVLLVGHARAAAPSTVLPAAFCVEQCERRFFAITTKVSYYVPLASAYLRIGPSAATPMVRVGPQAPWSPARLALLGRVRLRPSGVPDGPLGPGFDFHFFNAASFEQQLEVLRSDARIVLEGLLAGVSRREVRLPAIRPVVFVVRHLGNEKTDGRAIRLRCDTLTIDTDHATCALTYRGEIARHEAEQASLVVTAQAPGEEMRWRQVREALDRAVVAHAIEPDLLAKSLLGRVAQAAPARREGPGTLTGRAPLDVPSASPDLPIESGEDPPTQRTTPSLPVHANPPPSPVSTLVNVALSSTPYLPFAPSIGPSAASRSSPPLRTGLPFKQDASPPPQPPLDDGALRSIHETAVAPPVPASRGPVLPFVQGATALPSPPPLGDRSSLSVLETAALPGLPAAPAPPAAAAPIPDHIEEAMPLREYVTLRVALERALDPTAVLATRGLAAAEWRKLHRAITRRGLADAGFESRLRKALDDERRSAGGEQR